jgi:aminopeptidase-like protein
MIHEIKQTELESIGLKMHQMMTELFPICRSITGKGIRATLKTIQSSLPIQIFEVPSGTRVFDWEVPREWNIHDAYILDGNGKRVVDWKLNNLHVVGYSVPVDRWIDLDELQKHLHSLEQQPDAIPYITSYYQERWGFCLRHADRVRLKQGSYRAVIDSSLENGSLAYGEIVLPGTTDEEIFLSTYVCHPSMANNELSGPVVTVELAKWLASQPRRYTYRIVFIPETIGSLVYLSRHLNHLKEHVVAGFVITCVGDERAYSFLPSRKGNTLADRAALNILDTKHPNFDKYSFLDRGSDERQYCSPGVDLPMVSIMRSKYGTYPEYHTSLDNLSLVTPDGLAGAYAVLRDCVELLEHNRILQSTCLGEPQLGRRGLYPTIQRGPTPREASDMLNLLAYADGKNDLIEISRIIQVPCCRLYAMVDTLIGAGLLKKVDTELSEKTKVVAGKN